MATAGCLYTQRVLFRWGRVVSVSFESSQHFRFVELDESPDAIEWNSFLAYPQVDRLALNAQYLRDLARAN